MFSIVWYNHIKIVQPTKGYYIKLSVGVLLCSIWAVKLGLKSNFRFVLISSEFIVITFRETRLQYNEPKINKVVKLAHVIGCRERCEKM
jgi:hypothetical protein